MMERQQRRVLAGSVFLVVILLLALYFTSNLSQTETVEYRKDSVVTTQSVYGQISTGELKQIQSGKTSIFVDEFGRCVIPPAKTLESMEIHQLEEIYYRYIENIQTLCNRMNHMGNEDDGGYHICETYLGSGECLVYSFGIRKDFSFDDAIAQTYGCEVHSFDPGDGQKDHKHSEKVTFHAIGIGGEDKTMNVGGNNWKIMSFDSIKNMLGHTGKKLDIVKIDTEAAEWDSLATMLKTGVIKDINLLIIEFHEWIAPGNNNNLAASRRPEVYRRYLNIMRGIHEAGFRLYFFRMWPWCHYVAEGVTRTACHEVHFVNIDRSKFGQ